MKMPKQYVIEMFCDRVAACKIYNKENYNQRQPLEYYMKGRSGKLLHEESKAQLEKYLKMLAEKGEDYTFRYIRNKEVVPLRIDRVRRGYKWILHICTFIRNIAC